VQLSDSAVIACNSESCVSIIPIIQSKTPSISSTHPPPIPVTKRFSRHFCEFPPGYTASYLRTQYSSQSLLRAPQTQKSLFLFRRSWSGVPSWTLQRRTHQRTTQMFEFTYYFFRKCYIWPYYLNGAGINRTIRLFLLGLITNSWRTFDLIYANKFNFHAWTYIDYTSNHAYLRHYVCSPSAGYTVAYIMPCVHKIPLSVKIYCLTSVKEQRHKKFREELLIFLKRHRPNRKKNWGRIHDTGTHRQQGYLISL
jgi:hypothetical protein